MHREKVRVGVMVPCQKPSAWFARCLVRSSCTQHLFGVTNYLSTYSELLQHRSEQRTDDDIIFLSCIKISRVVCISQHTGVRNNWRGRSHAEGRP